MLRQIVRGIITLFLVGAVLSAEVGDLTARQATSIQAVATTNVNVRNGPGTGYPLIMTLANGAVVQIDGRSAESTLWVHAVLPNGQTGWLFSQYLNVTPDQLAGLPIASIDPAAAAVSAAPPPAAPASNPVNAAPAPSASSYGVVSGITGNARAIFVRGQQAGNRANVFSKIGDSITVSPRNLFPFGWGAYNLRDYGYLQPTLSFFASGMARTGNSFSNESLAANIGWSTATVLDPNASNRAVCGPAETPIACEYRIVKPSVALIMLGTNDMGYMPLDMYRANLSTITQISIDSGVIPVLSTLPLRAGMEGTAQIFNDAIIQTARAYDVPLWDFEAALRGLPANGLNDGIHPSYPPGTYPEDYNAAADMLPENLQYGYTIRNLTALQVLDALRQQVLY